MVPWHLTLLVLEFYIQLTFLGPLLWAWLCVQLMRGYQTQAALMELTLMEEIRSRYQGRCCKPVRGAGQV
jgi:hypothetical protein